MPPLPAHTLRECLGARIPTQTRGDRGALLRCTLASEDGAAVGLTITSVRGPDSHRRIHVARDGAICRPQRHGKKLCVLDGADPYTTVLVS